jgi:hypothetical protein
VITEVAEGRLLLTGHDLLDVRPSFRTSTDLEPVIHLNTSIDLEL